jgi:hypothetical protein
LPVVDQLARASIRPCREPLGRRAPNPSRAPDRPKTDEGARRRKRDPAQQIPDGVGVLRDGVGQAIETEPFSQGGGDRVLSGVMDSVDMLAPSVIVRRLLLLPVAAAAPAS